MPVGHAKLGVIKRTPTAEQPQSYIVTAGNKDYQRNRRNLLKVLELPWKSDSEILEQIQEVAELVVGTPTQTLKPVGLQEMDKCRSQFHGIKLKIMNNVEILLNNLIEQNSWLKRRWNCFIFLLEAQ